MDSCPLCDWKDAENCRFPPHQCLETHMRMSHGVAAGSWF